MVGGGTTEADDKYAFKQNRNHKIKKGLRKTSAFFGDIVRGALIEQTYTSTGSMYNNPLIGYFVKNSRLANDPSLNGKELVSEAWSAGALWGALADIYLIGMAAGTLGEESQLAQGVLAAKGLSILAYQGTKTVKRINQTMKERAYMKMVAEKFPELTESDLEKISKGLRE